MTNRPLDATGQEGDTFSFLSEDDIMTSMDRDELLEVSHYRVALLYLISLKKIIYKEIGMLVLYCIK